MKNNISNRKFAIFLAAALVLIIMPQVYALGVTPGRTTILFEPGLEQNISFLILNGGDSNVKIELSSIGELGRHIFLPEESFDIAAGQDKQASALIKLPNELSPGSHKAQIVVSEIFSDKTNGETYVGASASVITEINVIVPYPGKYAEADLYASASKDNNEVDFVMPIVNKGKLGIEKASAEIEIYDSLNRKKISISTNTISIAPGERGEVLAKWTGNITPGEYNAVSTIIYDDQVLTIKKDFNVGNPVLEIDKISVNDFTLGEIAKFEILLENKWGEKLKGAYSKISVYDSDGSLMDEFRSPLYDISPLEKAMIVSYWDTTGVKKGIYEGVLTIKYGENSVDKRIKLYISENSIEVFGAGYAISSNDVKNKNLLVIFLSILVAVLILINALWFLFMRKKLSKRH